MSRAGETCTQIPGCMVEVNERRHILTDKHISISKRLKLFDRVSPTVLFGLAALAMSAKQREQLRVLQRRMLRLVVGWVRHDGEDWAITMRRMNRRVADAQKVHPIRCWCDRLATVQYKLVGVFGT